MSAGLAPPKAEREQLQASLLGLWTLRVAGAFSGTRVHVCARSPALTTSLLRDLFHKFIKTLPPSVFPF